MIHEEPKGIIELGNINIKCLIFKIKNDNSSEILSTSIVASKGIFNGTVTNIAKASDAIRSCISTAEKKIGISLKKINVVLEQTEFLCTKLSKDRKIGGSKIHKEDIEFLLKEGKKQVSLNDKTQSIIHIFNHNYIVDGKTFVEEPIDFYADYLSHEMTFVTMPKNNLKNINQTFIDCDIEIERFISSIFALGVKLLKSNEFQTGSILIDIGHEKTSLGLFKNLALVHSLTLPIGINHITKDISKVCSLTHEESEIIRNKIDFSFENNKELFTNDGYLKNTYFITSVKRKISESLILDIAKARLEEIFKIIEKQITLIGFKNILKTNSFIVGGGSNLANLKNYFLNFFQINVRKPESLNEVPMESDFDKEFNSCFGALKIIKDGWETEAIPEPAGKYGQKISFFAKIFGNRA